MVVPSLLDAGRIGAQSAAIQVSPAEHAASFPAAPEMKRAAREDRPFRFSSSVSTTTDEPNEMENKHVAMNMQRRYRKPPDFLKARRIDAPGAWLRGKRWELDRMRQADMAALIGCGERAIRYAEAGVSRPLPFVLVAFDMAWRRYQVTGAIGFPEAVRERPDLAAADFMEATGLKRSEMSERMCMHWRAVDDWITGYARPSAAALTLLSCLVDWSRLAISYGPPLGLEIPPAGYRRDGAPPIARRRPASERGTGTPA